MAKITSWIDRKLSYVGCTQLVQTILFGVQSYWAQLFLIPAKVLNLIDCYVEATYGMEKEI